MTEKLITGECLECESSFAVHYVEELVSDDLPSFCPFCGETIQNINEEDMDRDDEEDEEDISEEW